MHNPGFVPRNEMHKLQSDFQVLTNHLISVTRPDRTIIKKRTYRIMDFAVLADLRVKLKIYEKKDKFLDIAR